MDKYKRELQALKSWDQVQSIREKINGYYFITTAGHGYLVVPVEDQHIDLARSLCEYGFTGNLAVYLEEDCEMSAFLDQIGALQAHAVTA